MASNGKAAHCDVDECRNPIYAHGKCTMHYWRAKRHDGDTSDREALPERVTLRIPTELARKAERAAKEKGLDVAAWWRQVAEKALR